MPTLIISIATFICSTWAGYMWISKPLSISDIPIPVTEAKLIEGQVVFKVTARDYLNKELKEQGYTPRILGHPPGTRMHFAMTQEGDLFERSYHFMLYGEFFEQYNTWAKKLQLKDGERLGALSLKVTSCRLGSE